MFVQYFPELTAVLNRNLRKNQPTLFLPSLQAEKDAAENLKTFQTSPPILPHPRAKRQYIVDTNAFVLNVGCVLLQQLEDHTLRPMRYRSGTVTSAKHDLAATQKKWLAVERVVLLLWPYLGPFHFIIRTDREGLRWSPKSAEGMCKITRCQSRLVPFEFKIVCRAGIMSRAFYTFLTLKAEETNRTSLDESLPALVI